MRYALSVWGPSLTQNQLLRLQRLQNRAVRLAFSLNRSDHTSEYYRKIRWLKVTRLIQFHLACVIFHQYCAVRGIMFVPPIEFGNCTPYNTRTPPYFANSNRTRLLQTQRHARYHFVYNFFICVYVLCACICYCVCVCMYYCCMWLYLSVCICPSNEEERLCRSL